MEYIPSEDRSKLRYPDYWARDFNSWGINDWDTYWIEKQPQSIYITKHNSHTALADELRCLKQVYSSIHPAYDKILKLLKELQNITKDTTNKKIWEARDRITSIKMESELFELESDLDKKKGTQAGLQIARRGFQLYAGIEFDSVERERKRMKADEKNKEASSFIPNLQDRTQCELRTPENKEQMVLRRKKKVNYAESSDSDEYVEGSKYKNARSKQYVREENNSRESTPCPTTSTVTNTLIVTPNKPIITNTTFNQYSTHVILEETVTEKDNETTEEARFLFFIRHTLLDFVAMFKYLTPKVLDRDMKERSYIVECLSPILRAFRNAFPEVKYEWIEKDVESIKEVNKIFMGNINRRKTDVLVLRLSDMNELLKIEVSGPPYKSTKRHTIARSKMPRK
ncbi:unnamed protein product [Rhizophagus irregularis]|nr:unnamed protein product [Rhizophagus irregularis]